MELSGLGQWVATSSHGYYVMLENPPVSAQLIGVVSLIAWTLVIWG